MFPEFWTILLLEGFDGGLLIIVWNTQSVHTKV